MSDIQMCSQECPVQETCKRHAASGTYVNPYRQAYGFHEPEKGKDCEWYWEVRASDRYSRTANKADAG